MINKQNIRSMLENIVEIVNKDPIGADVKVALFISAAISFKNNSLLHPFPKEYINADKIKDFQRLVFDLEKIPNLEELITLSMGGNASLLPYPSIDLLYHILSWPKYNLESIKKPEFDKILCLSQINTNIRQKIPKPNHIFKVKYSESGAELKFISKKVGMETSYAFHGTRFFNIYSILNHGLQQHLNKIGLFGEGLYLAKEPDVSLLFSPSVLSWDKSLIGGLVSSIALCEYINDPSHVKVRKENAKNSDIPHSYILITNNEIVRVRYLLIFSSKKKVVNGKHSQSIDKESFVQNSSFFQWLRKNPIIVSVVLYLIMLFIVGSSNHRTVDYYKNVFTQFLKNKLNFL